MEVLEIELNVLRGLEYQVHASGNHIKIGKMGKEGELSFVGSKNLQKKKCEWNYGKLLINKHMN